MEQLQSGPFIYIYIFFELASILEIIFKIHSLVNKRSILRNALKEKVILQTATEKS